MQTKRSMFKEHSGHLRCIYVCRKDQRVILNKNIIHDEEEQLRCSRIMLKLYTVLIIGLLTLLGMNIIDNYFDKINAQIEAEYKIEQEEIIDRYRDIMSEIVDFTYQSQMNSGPSPVQMSLTEDTEYISAHQIQTADPDAIIYVEEAGSVNTDVVDVVDQSGNEYINDTTIDEMEFIYRVIEAEVTGTSYTWNGNHVGEDEMLMSKIRVCQVFLNRVKNTSKFSDITTLYEAVSQPGASSTIASGRYLRVTVTDLTKQAVEIALDPNTPDYTDGALFFLADGATYNKYGSYLFTDAVGHSFFK